MIKNDDSNENGGSDWDDNAMAGRSMLGSGLNDRSLTTYTQW